MPELWTVEQAANHWGVSTSRARAILASAGVRRISGYDADAVRNIHRPGQGARTDLLEPAVLGTAIRSPKQITIGSVLVANNKRYRVIDVDIPQQVTIEPIDIVRDTRGHGDTDPDRITAPVTYALDILIDDPENESVSPFRVLADPTRDLTPSEWFEQIVLPQRGGNWPSWVVWGDR